MSKCVVVFKHHRRQGRDGAQAPLARTCEVVLRYYGQVCGGIQILCAGKRGVVF